MRVLIAGCGYVGTALGTELTKAGHEVWGLRRDPSACQHLETSGLHAIRANLLRTQDLADLPSVDTLVISQAPSQKNDEYRTTYLDATLNLLERFSACAGLKKILLISSTSVYSTQDGSWVDETTDPMEASHSDPESRENAKVLIAQETAVLGSAHPSMVLRLSGIYGPGRNRLRAIREGVLQPSFSDHHMNRIHIVDIVRACRLLLERGQAGNIYLGSDDHPSSQKEFYAWLFDKLGLPLPTGEGAAKPAARSGAHGADKRISNKKLKSLGFQFRYPSYREGYADLIAREMTDAKQRPEAHSGIWLTR